MRQVGDHHEPAIAPLLDRLELDAELLDPLRARTARLLNRSRVEPLTLCARHLITGGVLLTLQPLEFRQQAAPLGFEGRQIGELGAEIDAAIEEGRPDGLEIVPEECWIEHVR